MAVHHVCEHSNCEHDPGLLGFIMDNKYGGSINEHHMPGESIGHVNVISMRCAQIQPFGTPSDGTSGHHECFFVHQLPSFSRDMWWCHGSMTIGFFGGHFASYCLDLNDPVVAGPCTAGET